GRHRLDLETARLGQPGVRAAAVTTPAVVMTASAGAIPLAVPGNGWYARDVRNKVLVLRVPRRRAKPRIGRLTRPRTAEPEGIVAGKREAVPSSAQTPPESGHAPRGR